MRETIRTPGAPAPIGPYAQAVRAGGFVFVSGQIAIDPATGAFAGGDVATQAKRALDNVRAIVEASGSSMSRVVRTTIFLKDIADFTRVNEVYATYFGAEPPARSTIQAGALPKGAAVEIDAIAMA
jgi:2-iminobutanoate/2-iminopropanoate deaminase